MMRRESYAKVAAQCLALVAAIGVLAVINWNRSRPHEPQVVAPVVAAPSPPKVAAKPAPRRAPRTPEPILDREAIARAEAALNAAHSDRLAAEARASEAGERLKMAQTHSASSWMNHRKFAATLRDPSQRIQAAQSRGEQIHADQERILGELVALNSAPRPRRKVLIDKSPVARRAEGDEFHFEVRGDRIAFIDLERLLDRVKTDARVQIRMSGMQNRVRGQVGPVGAFSIKYEVGRQDDDGNGRVANFGLTGWEILPESDVRGETFEVAQGPVSDFNRAINRLEPARDVITMWIYPDGFPLYRRLRESLHARGFLVAARPLPAGTAIRGSPSGSASAAQ